MNDVQSNGTGTQNGELWFEKYRPQTLDDMVISEGKLSAIRTWFVNFFHRKVEKKALLFTGPPGLGKTSLAHLILREFGYRVKEFNASDMRSCALVNENMYDLICVSDVTNSESPVGIIMDEVDGMLTGDRGGIDELTSFISVPKKKKPTKKSTASATAATTDDTVGPAESSRSSVWGPPIICICNIGNVKLNTLTELQKCCLEIAFTRPTSVELGKSLDRVIENEHMTISPDAHAEIIAYAQGDYRRLMCLLQHLFMRYGQTIDLEHVQESYHIFCQKEQDLHVKDNVKRILNQQLDYQTTMNVYHRDKSKAPMVMHKNYLKAIEAQKTTPFSRISCAIDTIDSLVDSDIIEKTIYNTQGWHLHPIQGLTCCYIPSYHINKFSKTRTIEASWTEVLGTTSHTKSSKKKIQELMFQVGKKNSYNNSDIQFLSELILFLMMNKREKEAVSLLESYNLIEPKILDKLSSIVKLNDNGEIWKGKTASEKKFIESTLKVVDDVVERGTRKGCFDALPHKLGSGPGSIQTHIEIKPKSLTKVTTKPSVAPALISTTTSALKKQQISVKPKKQEDESVLVPAQEPDQLQSEKNPKRKLVLVRKLTHTIK